MEFILYIALALLIFLVYVAVSMMVFEKFSNSKGLNRVFWFFIMLATFSFLFGNSDRYSEPYGYGGGGCEDDQSDFFSSDDSDYSSCSWDSEDSSWDCDDD